MNDKVSLPNTSVNTTIDADNRKAAAPYISAVNDPSGKLIENGGKTTYDNVTLLGNGIPGWYGYIKDGEEVLIPYQADDKGDIAITFPLYALKPYSLLIQPYGMNEVSASWTITKVSR